MNGNGGGKCSGMTVTVFGLAVTSLHGGTKDVYRHVSTTMLKSIMELRKSVYKVL